MILDDFSRGTPWGMGPDHFRTLDSQVATILRQHDPAAMAAAWAKMEKPSTSYTTAEGSIARIQISGPISARAGWLSALLGGTTLDRLTESIKSAITDPGVSGILFVIDSPGGTISGLSGCADLIFGARSAKSVVAYCPGVMASAAYWLGSAAHRIVVDPAAMVGSIGVLMVHTDWSAADARIGIKTTYLTAGHYKAMGNSAEPLSDEARDYLQERLSATYGVFLDAVAKHRGVSVDAVRSGMADGRIYIGQSAVDVGLADFVGTEPAAMELARTGNLPESGATSQTTGQNNFDAFVSDFLAANPGMKKSEAMLAVRGTDPAAYFSWLSEKQRRRPLLTTVPELEEKIMGQISKAYGTVTYTPEQEALFAHILAMNPGWDRKAAINEAFNIWVAEERGELSGRVPPGTPAGRYEAWLAVKPRRSIPRTQSGDASTFDALVAEAIARTPGLKKSEAMQTVQRTNPEVYEAWLAGQQRRPLVPVKGRDYRPRSIPRTQSGDASTFDALVAEAIARTPGLKKSEAMQTVQRTNPEVYEAWLAGQQRR